MAMTDSVTAAQQRLVFGRDRDPGVIEEAMPTRGGLARRVVDANPCVVAFGPGPEGATCRSCIHLHTQPGVAGRFLKCEFRRNTSGPATDHRAGWPACAKYEPGRQLSGRPGRSRPEAIAGELLTEQGSIGVPATIRSLEGLRNVTPGEEAPALERRCIHGFLGCSFGPAHAHLKSRGLSTTVMSPACSNCAAIFRGFGQEEFAAEYDESGRCRSCRSLDAIETMGMR